MTSERDAQTRRHGDTEKSPDVPASPRPRVSASTSEDERFFANIGFCTRCPQLDARAGGLCRLGNHSALHAQTGYCPAGVFGTKQKPPGWPQAIEDGLNQCRACPKHRDGRCAIDNATIRAHATEAVCPLGKFLDGIVGRIEAPPAPPATAAADAAPPGPRASGCCGG